MIEVVHFSFDSTLGQVREEVPRRRARTWSAQVMGGQHQRDRQPQRRVPGGQTYLRPGRKSIRGYGKCSSTLSKPFI